MTEELPGLLMPENGHGSEAAIRQQVPYQSCMALRVLHPLPTRRGAGEARPLGSTAVAISGCSAAAVSIRLEPKDR